MSAITRRINRLLDSHSISEEDLREIVEQYEGELSIVNQKLGDAVDLVRRGLRSEAMAIIGSTPSLIDRANELSIPRLDELRELMDVYGLPLVSSVDAKAIKFLTAPGSSIDSAQSSNRTSRDNVPPVWMAKPGVQPRQAVAANQSNSFKTNQPNFDASQPPPIPTLVDEPPPLQSNHSPTPNYVWSLIAAVMLLLCLGGVGVSYLSPTSPNAVLAELNREAGIVNPPEADVSQELPPETNVPPNAETEMNSEAVPGVDPKRANDKKHQSLEKLEELAASILKGEAFLTAEQENSLEKFSTSVKDELKRLEEQTKQLEEISLKPDEDRFAGWLREPEGSEQLTRFVEERKKEIDVLKQHSPLKDFEDQRKRLVDELKAWDKAAKQWESEQEQQPELILEVPDNFKVEQIIQRVHNTAKYHLQKSMTALLTQYEKRSSENQDLVESTESQLEATKEELADDWKRRRDSHRLDIYVNIVFTDKGPQLQIKPRCVIAFMPSYLQTINRLSLDNSLSIPLSQSSGEVNLPGRFQGWLTVMRDDSGIILKLDPRMIPQSIREQNPLLNQLDQFVKQQNVTFESYTELQAILETSRPLRNELEIISQWNEMMGMGVPVSPQTSVDTADNLYLVQMAQAMDNLRLLQSSLADDSRKPVGASTTVDAKINEHIKNLETLRDRYTELRNTNGLLDFDAKLVFGRTRQGGIGQSTFEPIETFELFFFPELVYGSPPNE